MLGGPTPLWVSSYTSYLLYKVQSPLTPCRQSHGQNTFSSSIIRETSLCLRDQNSGRECAWWTNSLVGQFLHQLSLVQSSRSIKHMQTVPWPKHFLIFNFKGGTSLCFTDQNSERECAWWTNSLVGQFLHQHL